MEDLLIVGVILQLLILTSMVYNIVNNYSGLSESQFKELKELLTHNKNQLKMANEKLDKINAALDTANATISEVKGIVVNLDGDVNSLDADIQKLKDQIANGGTVSESDLDALLVKSQSLVDSVAELKASASAVDDKTPPETV